MSDAPTHIDLYTLIPHTNIDYANYRNCEKDLKPQLDELGYQPSSEWFSLSSDSFGPLIRAIYTTGEDSETYLIWYG